MMKSLSHSCIESYRARTFRLLPGESLKNEEQAVQYVNERGFIHFWPIKDILLPSLWVAVAGDRPVADAHDDPGHVTWGWKDSLLGARRWYYAKVLRKRATLISLEAAPYFYALSENWGSPEDDYLTLYEQGRLTQEAKQIYEALLENGPLDTVVLRRTTRMTSRESDARFNRALAELQADFKILPVGVTQSGGWRYAFAYDAVHRHYPDLPEKARFIQEGQTRQELARMYFRSVGAARPADVAKLFGWSPAQVEQTLNRLFQSGELRRGFHNEGQAGEWLAIPECVNE